MCPDGLGGRLTVGNVVPTLSEFETLFNKQHLLVILNSHTCKLQNLATCCFQKYPEILEEIASNIGCRMVRILLFAKSSRKEKYYSLVHRCAKEIGGVCHSLKSLVASEVNAQEVPTNRSNKSPLN